VILYWDTDLQHRTKLKGLQQETYRFFLKFCNILFVLKVQPSEIYV